MGQGIDGSRPVGELKSIKRALCIAEFEARKAADRGDVPSYTNMIALVHFLANQLYEASAGSAILHIPGPESNSEAKKL